MIHIIGVVKGSIFLNAGREWVRTPSDDLVIYEKENVNA
jgi:hypothetical protein